MRGYWSGTIWGVSVSGAGLVLASLVGEQPAGNAPPITPQLVAPDAAQSPVVIAELSTEAPVTSEREMANNVPRVTSPEVEVAAPSTDTEPSPLPSTTDVQAALTTPSEVTVPDVPNGMDEPEVPVTHGSAPLVPEPDRDVAIATQPNQPDTATAEDTGEEIIAEEATALPPQPVEEGPQIVETTDDAMNQGTETANENVAVADVAPNLADVEGAQVDDAPVVAEPDEPATIVADAAVTTPENAPTAPNVDATDPEGVAADTSSVADPVAPDSAAASPELEVAEARPAPQPAPAPVIVEIQAPAEPDPAQPDDLPSAEDGSDPSDADDTPDIIAGNDTESPTADVLEPVPAIINPTDDAADQLPTGNTTVRINRPGAVVEEPVAEEVPEADQSTEELPDDAPALTKYASSFQMPEDAVPLSVLLIDDNTMTDAPTLVAGLPFGATVVIDALDSDATDRMRAYRDAGVEVAMLVGLPEGATPIDVEIAFEAAMDIVPENVAVFSNDPSMLQGSRATVEQLVEVLAADGRGLITSSGGLDNALRTASQAGVPADRVFRELDDAGQDAGAILRQLDQAAFRARQNDGAIVSGSMTADTLDVLQGWASSGPNNQVVLAPVSAVLSVPEN